MLSFFGGFVEPLVVRSLIHDEEAEQRRREARSVARHMLALPPPADAATPC